MSDEESFSREQRLGMGGLLADARALLLSACRLGMIVVSDDEQRELIAPLERRVEASAESAGEAEERPALSEEEYLALWPSLMHDYVTLADVHRRGMLVARDPQQRALLDEIERLLGSLRRPGGES